MLLSSTISTQKYWLFAGWENGCGSESTGVSACRKYHFVTSFVGRGKTGVGCHPPPIIRVSLNAPLIGTVSCTFLDTNWRSILRWDQALILIYTILKFSALSSKSRSVVQVINLHQNQFRENLLQEILTKTMGVYRLNHGIHPWNYSFKHWTSLLEPLI